MNKRAPKAEARPLHFERPHMWAHYWLPALVWLVIVAIFSTHFFGASQTGSTLQFILRALEVRLSDEQFALLHYGVRKTAHFTAYGTLSALLFRASRGTDAHRHLWKARYALAALAVCAATASLDEIHQLFAPGRTGNWHDVVLDLLGALFVQTAILFVLTSDWAHRSWGAAFAGRTSSSMSAATQPSVAER